MLNRSWLLLLLLFSSLLGGPLHAAYIGDASLDGMNVTDQNTIDTINGGDVTYAFYNDAYMNMSGSAETVTLDSINFWARSTGTVTPFFALWSGANPALGSSYNVISEGGGITVTTLGLQNAVYGGAPSTVTVPAGDKLVVGFHQSNSIVPFSNGGTSDYLSSNGDAVTGVGSPLNSDSNFNLERSYAFNAGITVPEPGSALLMSIGCLFVFRRRR